MKMPLRAKEFVERNEMVRFQLDNVVRLPSNPQPQEKNGYKFTINDRSSFYDSYNLYFELEFKVNKLADGTAVGDVESSIINGSHSFINHLMIKSASKIIFDTDNLHEVTFVKNLLEYSEDYSRSVAKKNVV